MSAHEPLTYQEKFRLRAAWAGWRLQRWTKRERGYLRHLDAIHAREVVAHPERYAWQVPANQVQSNLRPSD